MKNLNPSTNRRTFLKLSGGLVASAAMFECTTSQPAEIEIEVVDDLLAGHLMFHQPQVNWPEARACDLLIVGGGIAGLAAAVTARDRDPIVCELGRGPGGSSASGQYKGLSFAQGAHYELEQPAYFGREVLQLLEDLNIIRFEATRNIWTYVDQQWLIDPQIERRCFQHGYFRKGVLPDNVESQRFEELLAPFEGRLPLPTRLIEPELHYLDSLSFTAWLKQAGLPLLPDFKQALDYQMKDDYGAGADLVSALAGIHYYRCRPYYTAQVQTFSPPNGNGYFVEKLAARLDPEQLLTGQVVTRIQPQDRGFLVDVLSAGDLVPQRFLARELIYAGHKHGLRQVLPQESHLFGANRYAPWMVMNLVLEGPALEGPFWQNEVLSEDPALLGFVNSMALEPDKNLHVLTVYYCLPSQNRRDLEFIQGNIHQIVGQALDTLCLVLETDIRPMARKAFIKLHGHAMPIPGPGYLFRDGNLRRGFAGLTYAGVDNSRLPLIYEALDSGILAASLLKTGS